jgi:hypothetical protein
MLRDESQWVLLGRFIQQGNHFLQDFLPANLHGWTFAGLIALIHLGQAYGCIIMKESPAGGLDGGMDGG